MGASCISELTSCSCFFLSFFLFPYFFYFYCLPTFFFPLPFFLSSILSLSFVLCASLHLSLFFSTYTSLTHTILSTPSLTHTHTHTHSHTPTHTHVRARAYIQHTEYTNDHRYTQYFYRCDGIFYWSQVSTIKYSPIV